MAHEIKQHDNLVLASTGGAAWHGMGRLFDGDLTPRQAAAEVFPFTVIQKTPLFRDSTGRQHIIEDLKINVRSDDESIQLGQVSGNYCVVQPNDMADFCEALAENGGVKVETAGSIRNGSRLWFLLRGEAFDAAKGDTIYPYVCVSNGYDGGSSFRVTPTTVRVVCSNTLHAVIPRMDKGLLEGSAIAIRHTSNVMDRIEEAKKALAGYSQAIESTKSMINTLIGKEINSDQLKQFFSDCYQELIQEIPENPSNKYEENRRAKAMSAFASFSQRFDDEKGIAGTNLWTAANAFSGLVQHSMKARGADDVDRIERRVESNLFGLGQDRTQVAFQRAFRMALAQ